jgi:hypothetical protein
MDARRYFWLFGMLLFVAACSGSGSSGFDNLPGTENAAIEQALTEQRCVESRGLTICPAEQSQPFAPTPTPTETPTVRATAIESPPLAASPTHTPPPVSTPTITSTRPPTPTPSAVIPPPSPAVLIGTGLDASTPLTCVDLGPAGGCLFTVSFVAVGFPAGAEFHVAVRPVEPDGSWGITGEAITSTPSAPEFDASLSVNAPRTGSQPAARLQIAVLVFLAPPQTVAPEVQELADTGADFAFVTGELALQPSP